MKILVVQESDWIKRNPHQQHHLMELLGLRGHQIHVIDYEIDWQENDDTNHRFRNPRQVFTNYRKVYNTSNVTVIRPPLIKLPVFNYMSVLYYHRREIKNEIKRFKPDIIIGFGILNTNIAARLAKKANIPFVYYFIDVLYELIPEPSFRSLGKSITKDTINKSSYVLSINRKLHENAVKLGANPHKMSIIGAGINLKQFNFEKNNGMKIRKHYNINPTDTVLLFMGFLYNFAGLVELAEHMGNNRAKYQHVKLLIVGDGDAYDKIRDIRDKYSLEEQIILTGRQNYKLMPDFIAAGDVCILPAHQDEIIMQNIVPIKLYEYMAMKKPVIATRLPGLVAEFGENNGIVYINKSEEILEVLKTGLNSNQNINKIGWAGYNFVKDNDWRKITIRFERILEDLILDLLLKDI